MEDNKKNAKILSDEELENVAGGIYKSKIL